MNHSSSKDNNSDDPISAWEQAYLRFETPEEERRKFVSRLQLLGALEWDRELQVIELFCGHGNGMHALSQLGFRNLVGIDLSFDLLSDYSGSAHLILSDCRKIPLVENAADILIVQGGLHHLLTLPDDLNSVLHECHRVLRTGGKLVVVEPWNTPFLQFVHWVCEKWYFRKLNSKIDALATMIEHERETYFNWLNSAQAIEQMFSEHFEVEFKKISWGKIMFVGSAS